MGKKSKKNNKQPKKTEDGLNIVWFFVAASIASFMFFGVSIWLRTPPEKIVHLATHKTKKRIAEKKAPRSVKGYKVNR